MKKTGPSNKNVQLLIEELKKDSNNQKADIWKRIAKDLEKSTRQRRVVNISRINRFTKENETVIVPGKVLGSGELNHVVTVAALSFSNGAKQIIEQKGKCLTIQELLKNNPKGKDVRIIG
ncbi:50S ribosomal protein L18e [Candidatus Woesearchaeota archaeon CG10_big_fil_rev_8_21_14_0_10_30_7]|nr:MAG: 50S ribosomal protein L18e [Candidatus Woesearchaeota archaeon CG10_big_fil_rev_8_21_14_0_10_30_7]